MLLGCNLTLGKTLHTIYVQIFEECNFRELLGFPQFYFRGSLVIASCTSTVL